MAQLQALGDPFGAALSGKRAAVSDISNIARETRTNRASDLEYDYNKWYQPLKQAEQQNATAKSLLEEANRVAHYSGDFTAYNRILSHYLGVPLEALPPGYNNGKGGAPQQKAADLASGGLPIPFAYPDVAGAGGAFRQVPTTPGVKSSGDPEIDKLMRDLTVKRLQDEMQGTGTAADVPHLDPMGGVGGLASTIPTPPAQSQAAANGAMMSPENANAMYNIPEQVKQTNTSTEFSPWADEYQGQGNGN